MKLCDFAFAAGGPSQDRPAWHTCVQGSDAHKQAFQNQCGTQCTGANIRRRRGKPRAFRVRRLRNPDGMPPSACANCGAPAGLQCPTCLDLKRPTAFCSKACYTSAWPQHKALHRLPASSAASAAPGATQQPGPPGQHPTSPQPPGTPGQHPTSPQQLNSPGQLESPQQASCFELADVPGKGIGAVATRDIKRGERILAERPLFTIDLQARSPEAGAAAAEASVRRLAPELREQVGRLEGGWVGRWAGRRVVR